MKDKSHSFIFFIAIYLTLYFITPVLGVGILPSDRDAGLLNNTEHNFSFTLTNSYPYNLNITFETLTNYLKSFVKFNPSNLTLNLTNKVQFEVIIDTRYMQTGNHSLIFRPKVKAEKPEINYTGNMSVAGMVVPTATGVIRFETIETINKLIGYKDLWIPDPANPTLVNGTLVATVPEYPVSGIKFTDYVPLGTNFTCTRASVTFCNSSDGLTWSCGAGSSLDYNVTDKGNVNLSGIMVHACEYSNGNKSGWKLSNNASVKIMYQLNITTSGLYKLPMALAGWDPAIGKEVRTTSYGVVRVIVPGSIVEPAIEQTEFLMAKTVIVGKPVTWNKEFKVYNLNPKIIEATFEIEVFEDTLEGFIFYLNEKGKKIEERVTFKKEDSKRKMKLKTRLAPLETRSYEIRILTPPVLETGRDIEIIKKPGDAEDKMIEVLVSIFLKNLAAEDYENVRINLPIPRENIIYVKDDFGNVLSYTRGESSTTIIIDKFGAKKLKEIIIRYKQKENLPVIVGVTWYGQLLGYLLLFSVIAILYLSIKRLSKLYDIKQNKQWE